MDKRLQFKLSLPTDYSKVYDHFYEKFAKQKNYKITEKYKTQLVSVIFQDLSEKEKEAITSMIKYYRYEGPWWNNLEAAKNKKGEYTYKELLRNYELASKHMYSPQHISLAVRGYYNIKGKNTKLTEADFGRRKYIVTALNKAGIETREQLMKHLSNGWYYLWTIPGCGDNARQSILRAIDKWEGRV